MNKTSNFDLPTNLLDSFNDYFTNAPKRTIVNIDSYLKQPFDMQIQRFEDAVMTFRGSIPPNRFSHFYVAIVTEGHGVKTVGLNEFDVKPNTIIFIPSGIIHSSHSFTKETKGYILSFNPDFLLLKHTNKHFLNELSFFKLENQPFLYFNENQALNLLNSFENIAKEYVNYQLLKDDLMQLYILELLIKVERIYKTQITQNGVFDNTATKLTSDFKNLIEKHFLKEKQVGFYAQNLTVHPNHLNAIIKQTTGKTCSEWIHERVLLEAKCLLQTSDLSIKEIANYLSFEDASYFSKYFKKLTSKTPLEYKTQPPI
jgi:AraC family transcriptional regulator, transcriptional activator of pobA